MADSTTNLDLIAVSQAAKETTDNALSDSFSPASYFGRRASTTAGLTWGYYGAVIPGSATRIANGTIALTASATNYLYATSTGTVTKATSAPSGWPNALLSGAIAMAEIITGASTVTSYKDWRQGGVGVAGSGGPPSGAAGGDLAGTYPNPTLGTVISAAGPIGDGTHVAQITYDAKGRLTTVASVAITGAAPSGAAGGDLAGTYPNPTVKASVSLTTPVLGVATATSINKVALTAPATGSTLTILDGKTLTANKSLTLDGTDSTTMTFPPASASIGYLNIPQNSQSTAYTTVLADAGKHLLHPSADTTARTFTIDSNANVAFPIGTAITFVNQNAAGVMTIAITSDTMRLAGAGTTGSRTLAANGVATAIKLTSTEWIISGTGLT